MIYAQIKNGLVINTIVVDDTSVVPLVTEGFDSVLRVDNISPQPGIGFTYDGTQFTPPVQDDSDDQGDN